VFDKTGTLTEHRAGIRDIETFGPLAPAAALDVAARLESRSSHPLARAFPLPEGTRCANEVRAVPGAGLEGMVDGRRYRIGRRDFAANAGRDVVPDAGNAGVWLGDEDGLIARFDIAEELRPGVTDLLAALRARGIEPVIASGDAPAAVRALAERLGVEHWHAALRPDDKLALIRRMQQAGDVVVMVGDGINDAPVLAGADVSIAMGSGTSLAQHSADCVLMSGNLGLLTTGLDTARRAVRIIRQNLAWAVCYNLLALPLAATGWIMPWMAAIGMSASSLIVTLNALRLGRCAAGEPAGEVGQGPVCAGSMGACS